jgi:hypothetical protein
VWPPRLVQVFWCETWRKAQLEGYRFDPSGDMALIRFPPGDWHQVGDGHWVPMERVRYRPAKR